MVENVAERTSPLMEVDVKDLQAQAQVLHVIQPLEIRQSTPIYFTELD